MSEGYITMDTDVLRQDIETIRQQLEAFKQEMKAMQEEATQICAMWEGPASQTFAERMAVDHNRMAGICRELESYAACMEEAYQSYISCENEIADAIAALRL